MANVQVFTDKQTDGRAKNNMPPIYRCGDIIKKRVSQCFSADGILRGKWNKAKPKKRDLMHVEVPILLEDYNGLGLNS